MEQVISGAFVVLGALIAAGVSYLVARQTQKGQLEIERLRDAGRLRDHRAERLRAAYVDFLMAADLLEPVTRRMRATIRLEEALEAVVRETWKVVPLARARLEAESGTDEVVSLMDRIEQGYLYLPLLMADRDELRDKNSPPHPTISEQICSLTAEVDKTHKALLEDISTLRKVIREHLAKLEEPK